MFFLYNVQEFGWIPVHLLVHFVILEILVHFYPISSGLKQTTFWYFSRTRPSPSDYTCNSWDENYWGVGVWAAMNHCEGDEAEDRFSCKVLTIGTRVLPWCTFNYYYLLVGYFCQRFNTLWQSISWHWAVMLSRSIIIRRADSQSVEAILGCIRELTFLFKNLLLMHQTESDTASVSRWILIPFIFLVHIFVQVHFLHTSD